MSTVLTTFGIGEDSERLYRRVLRRDGEGVPQHARALGWSDDRVRSAMRPLIELRLVRENLESALVAPHPRAALSRLVDRETARLDLRRRELEDVAAAVGDFSADHLAGRVDVLDPTALDIIPAEALPSTVENLLRTTTGTIRSFHLEVAAGAATDSGVEDRARDALANGRELRSIYPVGVLDEAQHLAWVREWAALGERQRVVEAVPSEFVVLGEEAVLSAPLWGATASTAVLIRLPLLVAAFTAVFDEAWAGGLPVPDEGVEQDAETRLLALLGSGFKDEAIARYLGIGVRTVRRRVAALMDELSVHTRFQLGVVAERRGLLGRRG
jgi:DNA-binding CsgD family transcriptional regulator